MRSLRDFICIPKDDKRYENTKTVGGVNFIVNTTIENHKSTNRSAIVVDIPIFYNGDVKPGDEIIVHHNVFRMYYGYHESVRNGKSFIGNDLYAIDSQQYFMHRSPNGPWLAAEGYTFIEPVKIDDNRFDNSKFTPLHGKIFSSSIDGLKQGDLIITTPDCEYEFTIDGKLMYRVMNQDIVAKYE